MDADVQESGPGKCRKCGMSLTPSAPGDLRAYHLSVSADPPAVAPGQPVTDLEEYVGAWGQMLVVSDDFARGRRDTRPARGRLKVAQRFSAGSAIDSIKSRRDGRNPQSSLRDFRVPSRNPSDESLGYFRCVPSGRRPVPEQTV